MAQMSLGGATHKGLVAWLRASQRAEVGGFTRRLLEVLTEGELLTVGELPALRPDAYLIDVEGQRVTAFEVTITHPPTEETMARYVELWSKLDTLSWVFSLVFVDRTAQLRPVELYAHYFGSLAADVAS